MENILLVLNVNLAVILVIIVLLQKSEGGALGIGVSQESFMFSRTAGDFMTKATAIIATLLAYIVTKDDKYANWHKLIHDWSYKHFPDKEYGEWFGYLHRDGRISVDLKGIMWKGPFHLPRMQLVCWKLLEEYI